MKRFTLFLASLFLVGTLLNANDPKDDIMLQSFGWDEFLQPKITAAGNFYKFVQSKAIEWKAAGFDMIWMPPPSRSTGGVGYLPTELFNFNSTWGTESDLRAANSALRDVGLHPIADVVANHRNGTNDWSTFTNPAWGCHTICSTDEVNRNWLATRGPRACGNPDTGDDFDGGRDLDHTHLDTRNGIKEFLEKLKEQGFVGWRWDMTKGFSPSYVAEYIGASRPYFSVGEFWDGNANTLRNWVDNAGRSSATFDFAQYYAMDRAFKNNTWHELGSGTNMAGLAGVFGYAEYAVTFVDNHDTFVHGSAQLGDNVMKAYAYILTHPGIPSVFIAHYHGGTYRKDGVTRTYVSHKDRIDPIMAVRKANRIDAWSSIQVVNNSGFYAALIRQRSTDAEPAVAVRIGTGTWSPTGTGWTLVTTGPEYAVWSKAPVVMPISPPSMSIVGGTYPLGQKLSIFAPAGHTIRFTTDGSEPNENSTLYTEEITLPLGTTTVRAITFRDGERSLVVTNTYTIQTVASSITVRFRAPATWTTCRIHVWETRDGTNVNLTGAWPGIVLQRDIDGFFVFSITNHTRINVGIVFNNGAAEQTVDLSTANDVCWEAVGTNRFGVQTVTCPPTGLNNIHANQLVIYPNPTLDAFTVRSSEAISAVHAYDNLGRAYQLRIGSDNRVDVSSLASGLYQIRIETENGRKETHRLVKK